MKLREEPLGFEGSAERCEELLEAARGDQRTVRAPRGNESDEERRHIYIYIYMR